MEEGVCVVLGDEMGSTKRWPARAGEVGMTPGNNGLALLYCGRFGGI